MEASPGSEPEEQHWLQQDVETQLYFAPAGGGGGATAETVGLDLRR